MDLLPGQDVYANLLADAIVAISGRASSATRRFLGDPERLEREMHDPADAAAAKLLSLASVEAIDPSVGGERLRAFLLSREALDIAVGIWVSQAVEGGGPLEKRLRNRFRATLAWYVRKSEGDVKAYAERLFDALRQSLQPGALTPSPPSDEPGWREELADRFLEDSTTANSNVLSLFRRGQVPDVEEAARFEEDLREAVAASHDRIEPPSYDGLDAIPLDRLYVDPNFSTRGAPSPSRLTSAELCNRINRTVILGDPGAGKSSFVRALAYRLATTGEPDDQPSRRRALPFLIELREYAAHKRLHGSSIVEFIEHLCKSNYQVDPPAHVVEYLLMSGRAVVIFDGLDELLHTRDRRKIRSDVEAFSHRFAATPMVVTSRTIGYAEAPLDSRRFDVVSIEEFDEKQVETYVERWFALSRSLQEHQKKDRAAAFLRESRAVDDLRANPLLLALMCGIYRRQNYIPRHRAGVYEQCALMLFDRWDRGRSIDVERPIEAHLLPALQHIARWIFVDDPDLQAGVTHDELVDHTQEYVRHEAIDNPHEALATAEDFVKFCHGRGWVLVETGTTADGEPLYGFRHRTFLEYFTAAWFASADRTTAELAEEIYPHVEVGEWDMVALLVVQLRTTGRRGSNNDFLEQLIERAAAAEPARRSFLLSFGVRTFEFQVPRPAVTRALAAAVLRHHIDQSVLAEAYSAEDPDRGRDLAPSVNFPLLLSDPDLFRPVTETFVDLLVEELTGEDEQRSVIALDAALHFDLLAYPSGERPEAVSAISDGVRAGAADAIDRLVRDRRDAALLVWAAGYLSVAQLIEEHGLGAAFCHVRHPAARLYTVSPADELLSLALHGLPDEIAESAFFDSLNAVAESMLTTPPPWVEHASDAGFSPSPLAEQTNVRPGRPLPPPDAWPSDARFAALLLVAARLEAMESIQRRRVMDSIASSKSQLLKYVAPFVSLEAPDYRIASLLEGLTPAQAELIRELRSGPVRLIAA
jgi:hypothetical protein